MSPILSPARLGAMLAPARLGAGLGLIALIAGSCGARDAAPAAQQRKEEANDMAFGGEGGASYAEPPPSSVTAMAPGAARGMLELDEKAFDKPKGAPVAPDGADGKDAEEAGPATRAWFPESFLWMPLVETNATGQASVTVKVPDTLTTWRLLALAQSERGGQGGATSSFRSTLPAYVDVLTPSFLYAGDRASLAVQVVNQEATPLSGRLDVSVTGGTGAGGGNVSVAGYGSGVNVVSVSATVPGTMHVHAQLAGVDAVDRAVNVRPTGRPIDTARGGTLAGARTFEVDALPGGQFPSLDLVAFPGALSLVAREVQLAEGRGSRIEDAAYAYALARAGSALTGEGDVTADSLRTLSLHAVQRITRSTRSPDPATAAVALAGLQGAPEESLDGRLALRLADYIEGAQQPDGLWTVASGAPLDVALVATARNAWALGAEAKGARVRASGATERYAERLRDPTIAAWVLAAGIADPSVESAARKAVLDALQTAPDGSKYLPGSRHVSSAEATAVALLALTGDDAKDIRSDLAAHLLGRWTATSGFGPGYTNLVALRALTAAMGGEIPTQVVIHLSVDGAEVAQGRLDPTQPHAPVHLVGPGLDGVGSHTVVVTAEPAVPGLYFNLTSRAWLPYVATPPAGLEVRATPVAPLRVGADGAIEVVATGPAGAAVDLDIGIPAGVDVDRAALEATLAPFGPTSWRTGDGVVHVEGVKLPEGRLTFRVPVAPTLAGTLSSGAATIALGGESWTRPPEAWGIGK